MRIYIKGITAQVQVEEVQEVCVYFLERWSFATNYILVLLLAQCRIDGQKAMHMSPLRLSTGVLIN